MKESEEIFKLVSIAVEPAADRFPSPAEPRSHVWLDQTGRPAALGCFLNGCPALYVPDVGHYVADGERCCVRAVAKPGVPADVVRDTFHRRVVPLFRQELGKEVLHASAVLVDGEVVAFCASSGTGKSTIARGLQRLGFPRWADDAFEFEVSGARVWSSRQPFLARLKRESCDFFAELDHESAVETGDLDAPSGDRRPVRAVCILVRAEESPAAPVTIARIGGSVAFQSVSAHALCFPFRDTLRKRETVLRYLDLAAFVPVFELRYPTGLNRLPEVLERVVDQFSRQRFVPDTSGSDDSHR